MPTQRNKLAPEGLAAKAGNFLLNLAVGIAWLLRRAAGVFVGKKENKG